jgi:type IV secretory pathway TrbD component
MSQATYIILVLNMLLRAQFLRYYSGAECQVCNKFQIILMCGRPRAAEILCVHACVWLSLLVQTQPFCSMAKFVNKNWFIGDNGNVMVAREDPALVQTCLSSNMSLIKSPPTCLTLVELWVISCLGQRLSLRQTNTRRVSNCSGSYM